MDALLIGVKMEANENQEEKNYMVGDLLTPEEIRHCIVLYYRVPKNQVAIEIEKLVLTPQVMERINKQTNQKTPAYQIAYAIEHILATADPKANKDDPRYQYLHGILGKKSTP